MGYDDVIPYLGEFGRYQKRIYFLVCLPAITCAFHKLAGVFLLANPEHRCRLPFEVGEHNATYSLAENVRNLSLPFDSLTRTWSSCQYLDANFTDSYFAEGVPANFSSTCDAYIYDYSKYKSSTVIEWNLVCSKSVLRAISDSLFMLGVLVGSIGFGHLSDVYGRKPIFFISLVIQLVFGILAGVAPEFITYSISRFIVGATTSGVFLVAYVLAMEMVGQSYRLFAGIICMMFFSIGYMLTAGFAYFITDWRWLQISLTLPGTLFMCYYWFIPESARWLISKNRKEAAVKNIQKAAKENKVTIPLEILENLLDEKLNSDADKEGGEQQNEKQASVFDLMRYPNLRKKSILIFFDWFTNSATYYGLSWNTNNLGGNDLLNFVIFGAVEIPAYTFLLFTLNRWGRRSILCGCMLISGLMLILTMFVPEDMTWLTVTLAMLGKTAITASYGTIYIFTAEQFPTVVRNVGLGAASMWARFGGVLAPFALLLADFWKPLPLIIFGGFTFAGGLLSLMLPETHNKPLLETIQDGENFGKKIQKKIFKNLDDKELKPLNSENKNTVNIDVTRES